LADLFKYLQTIGTRPYVVCFIIFYHHFFLQVSHTEKD
jgi:hypothetical protein